MQRALYDFVRNVAETAHRSAVFPPHDNSCGTKIPAPETARFLWHPIRTKIVIQIVRGRLDVFTMRLQEKRRVRRTDLFAPVQVLHQTCTVYIHTVTVILAAQEKGLALCFVCDHKGLPKKYSGIFRQFTTA